MKADDFRKYRRTQVSEMRSLTEKDYKQFKERKAIIVSENNGKPITVSISDYDLKNGSPQKGDMIARNPKNHLDQWLVSRIYFRRNFELIKNEEQK